LIGIFYARLRINYAWGQPDHLDQPFVDGLDLKNSC
jgi:hypothetical protein